MLSGLICLGVFWIFLYLAETFLRNSRRFSETYSNLLRENGFQISPGHIRWQTCLFNRTLLRIGRVKPQLMRWWFNFGVVFGLASMLGSVILLLYMVFRFLHESKPDQVLQPVVPGMNLPWSQVLYYVTTLIIAGAFHEVGHAIAAVRENVRVNSFGLFLLLLYPGAFVELHTDQLEIISPVRKLRIFCAGVWHNFVLTLFALFVFWIFPYVAPLMYKTNQGVLVTWIHQSSSIASKLHYGDTILSVNDCLIQKSADWFQCLHTEHVSPLQGFCNSPTYIGMHNTSTGEIYLRKDTHEYDCCNETSSYRFCFYHLAKETLPAVVKLNSTSKTTIFQEYKYRKNACLPARLTITMRSKCLRSADCIKDQRESVCLKPLLTNDTRLVRIKHADGQDILFVGDPNELIVTITVSDHIPKYFFSVVNLPENVQILCSYIVSISSALAILNMMPSYFLDGHQTLIALMELLFPSRPSFRSKFSTFILLFGSLLLFLNILIGFRTLVIL